MDRVLPGDPDAMAEFAAALAGRARWLDALVDVSYLSKIATWDSPAGTAFAHHLAQVAPVLSALARRYGEAAAAIGALAGELADAQLASRSACQRKEWAAADVIAIERELGSTTDPVRRAVLDRAADEARRRLMRATVDVGAAEGRWLRADDVCARRLTALGHDEISDPFLFTAGRYARTTMTAGSFLGLIPTPVTRGIGAAAAAAGFWIDVGMYLGYGEGSWHDLATQVGWQLLGTAGSVFKAGSRVVGGTDVSAARRLLDGAKIVAKEKAPFQVLGRPPTVPAPGIPLTEVGRHVAAPTTKLGAVGTIARAQVTAAVEKRYAASWRIATAEGPVAQRLLMTSWTIEGGTTAYKKAESVRQRFDPDPPEPEPVAGRPLTGG